MENVSSWKTLEKLIFKVAEHNNLGPEYIDRINFEIKEINKQGANDLWVDTFNQQKKYETNKNGLVIPWILNLTSIDPIKNGVKHNIEYKADFPDIDVDFIPEARDPVKEYAVQKYGGDRVCSVGNWQTYHPKSAITDIICVYENDKESSAKLRHKITDITTKLPEEFDKMTLEEALAEPATEYDDFRELYKNYKEKVELAYRLVGLIKTQSKHAGGVIISDRNIGEHVPLSYKGQQWTSEWTEGLAAVQLSQFGFVKFDILGLKTLQEIFMCGKFIEKTQGFSIDWSEINPEKDIAGHIIKDGVRIPITMKDKKALKTANDAKTDTIFQFNTALAKDILRKGGVKSINDLLIYTSLGRPGPLPLVDLFVKNRDDPNQEWAKNENPKIVEILKDTYGVICFQEDLQSMWTQLCGMTIPEAEYARKAVAKKKQDVIDKLQTKIVKGFSKHVSEEEANAWWDKIKTFGGYCFNKCLEGNTKIETPQGHVPIKDLKVNDVVYSMHKNKRIKTVVKDVIVKRDIVYKYTLEDGTILKCTKEHKFLCSDDKMHEIEEIMTKNLHIKKLG